MAPTKNDIVDTKTPRTPKSAKLPIKCVPSPYAEVLIVQTRTSPRKEKRSKKPDGLPSALLATYGSATVRQERPTTARAEARPRTSASTIIRTKFAPYTTLPSQQWIEANITRPLAQGAGTNKTHAGDLSARSRPGTARAIENSPYERPTTARHDGTPRDATATPRPTTARRDGTAGDVIATTRPTTARRDGMSREATAAPRPTTAKRDVTLENEDKGGQVPPKTSAKVPQSAAGNASRPKTAKQDRQVTDKSQSKNKRSSGDTVGNTAAITSRTTAGTTEGTKAGTTAETAAGIYKSLQPTNDARSSKPNVSDSKPLVYPFRRPRPVTAKVKRSKTADPSKPTSSKENSQNRYNATSALYRNDKRSNYNSPIDKKPTSSSARPGQRQSPHVQSPLASKSAEPLTGRGAQSSSKHPESKTSNMQENKPIPTSQIAMHVVPEKKISNERHTQGDKSESKDISRNNTGDVNARPANTTDDVHLDKHKQNSDTTIPSASSGYETFEGDASPLHEGQAQEPKDATKATGNINDSDKPSEKDQGQTSLDQKAGVFITESQNCQVPVDTPTAANEDIQIKDIPSTNKLDHDTNNNGNESNQTKGTSVVDETSSAGKTMNRGVVVSANCVVPKENDTTNSEQNKHDDNGDNNHKQGAEKPNDIQPVEQKVESGTKSVDIPDKEIMVAIKCPVPKDLDEYNNNVGHHEETIESSNKGTNKTTPETQLPNEPKIVDKPTPALARKNQISPMKKVDVLPTKLHGNKYKPNSAANNQASNKEVLLSPIQQRRNMNNKVLSPKPARKLQQTANAPSNDVSSVPKTPNTERKSRSTHPSPTRRADRSPSKDRRRSEAQFTNRLQQGPEDQLPPLKNAARPGTTQTTHEPSRNRSASVPAIAHKEIKTNTKPPIPAKNKSNQSGKKKEPRAKSRASTAKSKAKPSKEGKASDSDEPRSASALAKAYRMKPPPSPGVKDKSLAIIGGTTSDDEVSYICWVQTASGTSWETLTQLPEMLDEMTVCSVSDGFIVVGGHIDGKPTGDCYHFSVLTMKWHSLPTMPTPRHCSSTVLIEDSFGTYEMYVLGGGVGFGNRMTTTHACESLDLRKLQWKKQFSMKQSMMWPISVAIRGCIYVLYNDQDEEDSEGITRSLQMYDTTTIKWEYKAPMPDDIGATCGAQAIAINDSMLVAGGHSRICANYLPATNTWVKMCEPLLHHQYGCMVVCDCRVFILGGDCNDGEGDEQRVSPAVEEFDFENNQWILSDIKLPMGLYLHHAVAFDEL